MVLQTSQVLATKVKCFPSCYLLYLEKVAFVVIKCSHDVLTFSHPYKLFSGHCRLYSFTVTLFFNSSNESCVFCSKPGSKSHRQLVLQPRLQGQLREKTTLLKKKKKKRQFSYYQQFCAELLLPVFFCFSDFHLGSCTWRLPPERLPAEHAQHSPPPTVCPPHWDTFSLPCCFPKHAQQAFLVYSEAVKPT